jgi:crotonobetainyl-CoA:carnitine CoA-transferase CaiB-like acyl-CoA transferase
MLPLPFFQMRVLDLTTSVAGAYATRFFADFGAEVFQVEDASLPDPLRADSLTLESLQRNRMSVAIDTATADGRDLSLRLARAADFAFVDASDQRYGPDELTAGDENLILVVIDDTAGSAAETGLAAAAGALTALFHRRQTGEAQSVRIDGRRVQGNLRFLAPDTRPHDSAPLMNDPQLMQDGFFETIGRQDGSFVRVDGVPYRFSRTPAHVRLPAPRLGEHTDLVLHRYLNLTDDEISRLRANRAIGSA